MRGAGDQRMLTGLRDAAAAVAAAWGPAAEGSTSVGQERAILRLFGVTGLDAAGRPLAAEVVERYLASERSRLGGGISLPFAMAMAEYDLGAQELALEVAGGNVDLGLEAELLALPERRAAAEATAAGLARAALDRIDANRTARIELLGVLGDPVRPWLGAMLDSPAIVDALDEARRAIEAGAAVVHVEVPPSRELSEGIARLGGHVERWRAAPSSRGGLDAYDPHGQPIPTGAQRALAVLRRSVDEVGAGRRGYVRLLTEVPPLAAPDQAVVAADERIDLVVADPMREIVSGRVDPDRALADHAFARRLLRRAGTRLLVPAGPLLVGADLASGMPSDPATRAGRALALQLLAVALAVRDGIPAASVALGALPDWLVGEPAAPARALAEVAIRRWLLPEHPLAFLEPALDESGARTWQALLAVLLPDAGEVDLVLRRPWGAAPARAAEAREAARVAAGLRGARRPPELDGVALEHARAAAGAALETLSALREAGWASLADQPPDMAGRGLGAEAVALRTEAFDPFERHENGAVVPGS